MTRKGKILWRMTGLNGQVQTYYRAGPRPDEMTDKLARRMAEVSKPDWFTRLVRLSIWLILALLVLGFWQCWVAFGQESAPVSVSEAGARVPASESLVTWAVNCPSRPASQPKTGKDFWALAVSSKALKVWDIELTQRRMKQNPAWQERGLFLPGRPTRARLYVQIMGMDVGADYLSWRVRRAGHPNWGRAIQIGSIGISLWAIQHNARQPGRISK